SDLQKIVPGFQSTPTYYGTYVFTIRGVGFQDTSLAGNPTVSVYSDEAPLPFSVLTNGATLDLERVEVLKGPQGTLFGNNATGGAINYIARKPTDHYTAGVDASYGRFNDFDGMAFVSGPITDTLSFRAAVRVNESGPWQKAYAVRKGDTFGGKDFLNGRLTLQWQPTDNIKASLTVNAWQDKGYTQNGQLFGIAVLSPLAPLAPAIRDYPLAPHNNRAADFNTCVNNSPFDPIANQQLGTTFPSLNPTFPVPPLSQGPGSVVQAGGQPTSCQQARKDNTYFNPVLRLDIGLGHDITLTSLTSTQSFSRIQGIDGSAMAIQDYQSIQHGKIETFFQEVRLAGTFGGKGVWLFGGNYENDKTWDQFLQTYNASTASPTVFAIDPVTGAFIFALALGPTKPTDLQQTDTYAAFAHAEYPIMENLIAVGGIRYTKYNKLGGVCGNDGGDGTWAFVAFNLQSFLGSTSPKLSPPGSCASTGGPPTFNSPPNGGLFFSRLKEDNISWQAGLNWKFANDQLAYVNISKGYKAGSYPTVALATLQQTKPVVQEALLSYEAGTKLTLMDRTLQFNAAAFYYDYTNKQILGAVSDILFGALPSLVNVPKSRVVGFEVAAVYTPPWLEGLTVRPAVSFQDSKIQTSGKNTCLPPPSQTVRGAPGFVNCQAGHFYNFDAYSEYADFTGQQFPLAPKWQGSIDAEYRWSLTDKLAAYAGGSVQFLSKTHNFFVNETPIPAFRTSATGATIFVNCAGAVSPTPVGPCPLNHPNDPLTLPSYALVDLRAGIDGGAWTAQAWIRNATDKHYWTSSLHVNDVLLRYTGMPRTYGVTVTYRYQ
ncbi:MAG TPA: TonB-dependent receptor, partial [Phenylobacterium sp.]